MKEPKMRINLMYEVDDKVDDEANKWTGKD